MVASLEAKISKASLEPSAVRWSSISRNSSSSVIPRSAAQPTAPGGRGGAVFYSAGDSPPTPRRCRVPEDRRSRLPPPALPHSNPVIGVKPADEYQFRVLVTPVGPYFKGGVKPITIRVTDFDRAAPHGTGHIKAGLNYAMSLHAIVDAHKQGFDENMYLDAATRTKVEETGGANFIFVTKDNKIVTPKSDSILPSITRRSLMYVAKEYLGLEVEEREVYLDEVKDFAECGLCGTAAVISPVGKINDHGKEICFPSGMDEIGPVLKKLYETLTGIQMGTIEAPEGWIKVIEE